MYRVKNNLPVCLTLIFCLGLGPAVQAQLPDFTPLVSENAGAVVNISTTFRPNANASRWQNVPDIPQDSPFYDFFRRFFGNPQEGGEPADSLPRTSLGSGFIISSDGYIITNNHVVQDSEEIVVRLVDRREFIAEIVGLDPQSDIAVLKIDGGDLPVVKLGDSDRLNVGEWVLAIGSPFQFDSSVTAGIVSAKGRSLPNENYVPFIQTDVAINPGNSGGPLFNLKGEVVGVNSQIYSRTGGFMGLSFAVPINLVQNVYRQILETGHVRRGWLGVIIQEVTRELAESFDMEKPLGALITRVLNDSPAAKAGFEISDVVIKFNGSDVIFSSDLPPIVGNTEIGKKVPVEIIRRGRKQTMYVTVEELPAQDQIAGTRGNDGTPPQQSQDNPLHIVVGDLTDEQRRNLELDHGVVIEDIAAGPAHNAGLRQGDILLLINNEQVTDVSRFEQLLAELPGNKPVAILVQRQGNPIFLALRLDDDEDN